MLNFHASFTKFEKLFLGTVFAAGVAIGALELADPILTWIEVLKLLMGSK